MVLVARIELEAPLWVSKFPSLYSPSPDESTLALESMELSRSEDKYWLSPWLVRHFTSPD